MHVLLCLDDRNGMLFHNRRQSRDRTVIQNIRRTAEKSRLWIAPISLVLFQGDEQFLSVDPFPLKRAKAELKKEGNVRYFHTGSNDSRVWHIQALVEPENGGFEELPEDMPTPFDNASPSDISKVV